MPIPFAEDSSTAVTASGDGGAVGPKGRIAKLAKADK
jgi:hypothetical protein